MTRANLPWILLAIVTALLVLTWSRNILVPLRSQVVSHDNVSSLRHEVQDDTSITDSDKAAFIYGLGGDGIQPYGKTVDAVISEASAKQAAEAAAAAAAVASAATAEHELAHDLTIQPSGFRVERGTNVIGGTSFDAKYKDVDHLVFLVRNAGSKTITAFQADASLTNLGGEKIFSGTLASSGSIPPGGTVSLVVDHTPDYFEADHARNASLSDVVVHYTTTRIDYADGTSTASSN